jgi:hypothetical protein
MRASMGGTDRGKETVVTVFHVTSWQVSPGRAREVAQTAAAAREIHRRHGFGASAWRAVVSGGDTATLWYLLMSPGLGEHFALAERLEGDAEWQDLLATRIDTADAAATLRSSALWQTITDLPEVVLIPSQIRPRAQLVTGYAAMNPAQRGVFASMAVRAGELLERQGLTIGFAEAVVAGERTGALSAVVGAQSLPALGAGLAALGTDHDWAAYQQEAAASADRPVLTTRTIRQELI